MFGTLIVCLPSEHQGGEVVLTHRGETVCFNTSEHSKYGQSHLAWYVISNTGNPVADPEC